MRDRLVSHLHTLAQCTHEIVNEDGIMETVTIENRSDLAQWAIDRAKTIVAHEGGNLCLAARDEGDEEVAAAAMRLAKPLSTLF